MIFSDISLWLYIVRDFSLGEACRWPPHGMTSALYLERRVFIGSLISKMHDRLRFRRLNAISRSMMRFEARQSQQLRYVRHVDIAADDVVHADALVRVLIRQIGDLNGSAIGRAADAKFRRL